ncbi:MBL fold metallo-hydrolase [Pusillimonas sp. CC-YST705]|uniref:MBL fold metallo-hydrolase n=1 Tax=Mesopusillimonas faecipullorum TaxID=2755040 RepID=A0ABS8C9S0_9BURK|nr:MBL fold metallo-hydrolase [Mesopusillimonas faecipullorum]MCB5362364.1 MBL fold metallo-hydrolase [Mesopusillimonas faecipullorum]
MSASPHIQAFFDDATNTVSYLVTDPATRRAAVIDPVLDYDHRSGKLAHKSAHKLLEALKQQGLKLEWIMETHAHADHLSAAPYLKTHTGAQVVIGEHISKVQRLFSPIFNLSGVSGEGSEFDKLVCDGETFKLGELTIEVMHTPGHTPACVSYRIGDAVFVGDTLFMPDYGTARADFPGGSARTLYRSIQKLLALPPDTHLYMCHDYKAPGRDSYAWETTVLQQRTYNVHVREGISEDAFVAMREARDATLAAPMLLLPAIQVNICAGHLPEAESNGTRYLKIPLRQPSA